MTPKVDSIKIRMYNTGSVGDCLLLLFYKANTLTFKMLIDCGGWKAPPAKITQCANDIAKTCSNKIDLLLVTHQHEDHVSGFNLARPVFDNIQFGDVWLSWAENPKDGIAKKLKAAYGKGLTTLKNLAKKGLQETTAYENKMGQFPAMQKRLGAAKSSLASGLSTIDFEESLSVGKNLKKGAKSTNDAMDYVKTRGKGNKPVYRTPGEIIQNVKDAEGIKFYILGPPRDPDLKFIKKEIITSEIYALNKSARSKAASDTELNSLYTSLGVTLQPGDSPFSKRFKMTNSEKREFNKLYKSDEFKWRQIEKTSSDDAGQLAIALTRLINNTSLAIAIEFESTGHVILLPADAQSGNWLSWQEPQINDSFHKNGGRNITELLNNTVFYKVGHHGSHNGTASVHGLDKMTHPGLVAFIPLIKDKVPTAWKPEGFPDWLWVLNL